MVNWSLLEKKYDSLNMRAEILNQGKSALFSVKEAFYQLEEPGKFDNVIITGAGDKYLIGLLAQHLWSSLSDIPISVYHSRTLAELKPKQLTSKTLLVLLSQSGQTRDTLSALALGKRRKSQLAGITNNPDGFKGLKNSFKTSVVENALPSTGTFHSITALLFFYMFTILKARKLLSSYVKVLRRVDKLSNDDKTISWAKSNALRFAGSNAFYVLGDGPRYPIARKTALIMLMEAAKTNAFSLRTEEFVHSLIETLERKQSIPLILLKPKQSFVSKELYSEIRLIEKLWKNKLVVKPDVKDNILSAQVYAVPLEWFSYYSALLRKVDPGKGDLVKKVRG